MWGHANGLLKCNYAFSSVCTWNLPLFLRVRHSRENIKGWVQEAQELICLCRGLEQWKSLKALDINLIDCSWGKTRVHNRNSQELELLWLLYDCLIELNLHKTTTEGKLRGSSLFFLSNSDYIYLGRGQNYTVPCH